MRVLGNRSKIFWSICLLILSKSLLSLSYFLLLDFLSISSITTVPLEESKHSPPTGLFGLWSPSFQVLAVIQLSSGLIYTVLLRKPFSGNGNEKQQPTWSPPLVFRTVLYSFGTIVLQLIWISGLQLCGAFRTILASSHYNFAVAGIVSSCVLFKSGPKLRGAILFGIAWAVLLLYDDMTPPSVASTIQHNAEVEAEEQTLFSRNSIGLTLLMSWSFLKFSLAAISKTLSTDLGGSTRLHAFSTLVSGIILFILLLFDILSNADLIPIGFNLLSMGFIIIVACFDYFVDNLCSRRMEASKICRFGTTAGHFSALLYALVWTTSNGAPTLASLFAFALIWLGVVSLTATEKASGGGSFVGYSAEGLPLFSFSNGNIGETTVQSSWRKSILRGLLAFKKVFEDSSSRKLFYLFIINLVFCIVEFTWGYFGNSLGLVADAFHTLFDCVTILVGMLHYAVIFQLKPTSMFPFGFARIEVLCRFINSVVVLAIFVGILWNGILRLFSYQPIDATTTLLVIVPGVFLKLLVHFCGRISRLDHRPYILKNGYVGKGPYKLFLEDTSGRIAIICSCLILHGWPGLYFLDPLAAFVVACLVIKNAFPLMKETGQILLLAVPRGMERAIPQALLQILSMDGVKGYKNHRFWTHSPDVFTGSMHIQVTHDTSEQRIIRQANGIFCSLGFSHFTIQLEKDEFLARRNSEILTEDENGPYEPDSEKIKNDSISSSSFEYDDGDQGDTTKSEKPLAL